MVQGCPIITSSQLPLLTAKQAILVLVGVSILMNEYGPRDIAEADILVGERVAMGFVLDVILAGRYRAGW